VSYNILNAIVYDVLWRFCDSYSSLRSNKLVQMAMAHCFPDWVLWKTEVTLKNVDTQVETLKEEWKEKENEAIVEKFQREYPNSKVTTHDEDTGAVLIEHPPDGSQAQELLGGTMEIRSPWGLSKE